MNRGEVEFRVLGPLEVWRDGRLMSLAPRQQGVLGALLLQANRVIPIDQLIWQLWEERPPMTARNTLQSIVLRLRRMLADGRPHQAQTCLLTRSPGYLLRIEPGQVDLHRYEHLVLIARQAMALGNNVQAAAHLRAALGLWRGPVLAGAAAEGLHRVQVPRFEETRLAILDECIDIELLLGRQIELISELTMLVREYPLQERFYGQLMVALYRAGRQADSLMVFQTAREVLAEELGIDPGRALMDLQRAILRADESLDLSPGGSNRAPAAATTPAPAQLPVDIPCFAGRQNEMLRLSSIVDEALANQVEAVIAIDGAPGVGKSALALHLAHQWSGSFPDGQLYVNLQKARERFGPMSTQQVVGQFLRDLRISGETLPPDVPDVSATFRSEAAGRRLLLVLDNASCTEEIVPLLPASPNCVVLVSSRRVLAALEGATYLHLDVLPDSDGVELLGKLAGHRLIHEEPKAAEAVVGLCGGLPLALRIAGIRLASRAPWTMSSLAERLLDRQRRLDELAIEEMSIRSCFELSWQHLTSPTARAFEFLGLLDSIEVSVSLAARLLNQEQAATEVMLEQLVDNHLLGSPGPGRYSMPELLRLFARERCVQRRAPEERRMALARASEEFESRNFKKTRAPRDGPLAAPPPGAGHEVAETWPEIMGTSD